MNREIKYRAWHKKEKKMFIVLTLDWVTDAAGIYWVNYQRLVGVPGKEPAKEFELMQYTGLKDKNGKEVYEGDIVEEYNDNGWYQISFQRGGFWLSTLNDNRTIFFLGDSKVKVIGNIYENPELLK